MSDRYVYGYPMWSFDRPDETPTSAIELDPWEVLENRWKDQLELLRPGLYEFISAELDDVRSRWLSGRAMAQGLRAEVAAMTAERDAFHTRNRELTRARDNLKAELESSRDNLEKALMIIADRKERDEIRGYKVATLESDAVLLLEAAEMALAIARSLSKEDLLEIEVYPEAHLDAMNRADGLRKASLPDEPESEPEPELEEDDDGE